MEILHKEGKYIFLAARQFISQPHAGCLDCLGLQDRIQNYTSKNNPVSNYIILKMSEQK